MIKKGLKILLFIFLCIINVNVYAEDITVDDIIAKFNETYIPNDGQTVTATKVSEGIKIDVTGVEEDSYIITLDENILTLEIENSQSIDDLTSQTRSIQFEGLVDAYGQLLGYEPGDLGATILGLNSYTIEKEGYELKYYDNKKCYKLDITKKVPLYDYSGIYLEKEDFNENLGVLRSEDLFTNSMGEIDLYKFYKNNKFSVIIAEEDELSSDSYNSFISFLEAFYDNKNVINYFKSKYKSIADGNKEFGGMSIIVNTSDISEIDDKFYIINFDTYKQYRKFMRVDFDKDLFLKSANEFAMLDKSVKNPKTGINAPLSITFTSISLLLAGCYIVNRKKAIKNI